MAHYFVIYIPHRSWQACLDVMRLLCDPEVQAPSHLTVRGPYDERPELDSAWYRVRDIHVSVVGVEVFFGPNQNTVSLKCELPDLKLIWWKKHYKNGVPHITIYDGASRSFAENVARVLSRYEWNFSFLADRLHEYISSGKQARLDFRWEEYAAVFHTALGFALTREELRNTSQKKRLEYLDNVARLLQLYATQEHHILA